MPAASPAFTPPSETAPRRGRRVLLWGSLVGLLLIAQSLLVWLTFDYENRRVQEQTDAAANLAAAEVRQTLARDLQGLQSLTNDAPLRQWRAEAAEMLQSHRELVRIERRDALMNIDAEYNAPFQSPIFSQYQRENVEFEVQLACASARRQSAPLYSRSYFVPLDGGIGIEVMDVCLPSLVSGKPVSFVVGTIALGRLLDEAVSLDIRRANELTFVEGDGTRLARGGLSRGKRVFWVDRVVDLPGRPLQLRTDSATNAPGLVPNLNTALVLGLSLALSGVVLLLARDVRRRSKAEAELAGALALHRAMDDSLVTGLRARDRKGRITYVNQAFCEMVGYAAADLIGKRTPPYWPPDLKAKYAKIRHARIARDAKEPTFKQRRGERYEATFQRRNGERFPVMVFEAPLVDRSGRHTGWMSAAFDVSDQRRVEEQARQEQERLQVTARFASVGEMASLLSHELNQPLAAIASYATGSLNLMHEAAQDRPASETMGLLREALESISQQAKRAGRVIKGVHDFVRRRTQAHEPIRADVLIESVRPLVRLQARKSRVRVKVSLGNPIPYVLCDHTMVEQVLLNLTRNGMQAMENKPADRELLIKVRQTSAHWVTFSVIDSGRGVPPDVAKKLFTAFFTTRSEGMGLGLSLCRSVIEQHGGVLDFTNLPPKSGSDIPSGAEFRFTLRVAPQVTATQSQLATPEEKIKSPPSTRTPFQPSAHTSALP